MTSCEPKTTDQEVPHHGDPSRHDRARGKSRERGIEPPPDRLVYVNSRLLLITLLVVLIGLGLVYAVHSIQMRGSAEHFVQQADDAEADGDLEAAIKNLTLYLNLLGEKTVFDDPQYVGVLNRLADLHQQRAAVVRDDERRFHHAERAFHYYEQVLRYDPDRFESRENLVEMSLLLRRHRDALLHIDLLLSRADEPATDPSPKELDRKGLLLQRGTCQEFLGDIAGAQKSYCKCLIEDPKPCDAYIRLAGIVAMNPGDVCTREEIEDGANEETSFVSDAFPTEMDGSAAVALKTTDAILSLMIENGAPTWEAQRQRAVFLSSLPPGREQTALFRSVAQRRAEEFFAKYDQDQNGTLSREEAIHHEIPAFSDNDGDGRVGSQELVERLMVTESTSRLQQAEASIERALESVEDQSSEANLDVQESAVRVFLTLAESFQYVNPLEAREYVVRARSHATRAAELAAELDDRYPASLFAQAQLELRTLGFEANEEIQQQRLKEAESLLRSGYRILETTESETEHLQSEDARLQIAIIWTLADVLISRLERASAADKTQLRHELIPGDTQGPEANVGLFAELEAAEASLPLIEFLKGRLHFAEKKWKLAEEAFQNAAVGVGQVGDVARRLALLRAQCAERLGNSDTQLEHTLALINTDPTWGPARVAHAEAYLNAGRIDEAIEEYSTFAAQPEFTERYIRLLFAREARRPFSRRRWQTIEDALEHLEKQPEYANSTAILRSELLYQQALVAQLAYQAAGHTETSHEAASNLDQAEKLLQTAVSEDRDDRDLWVSLIELIVRRFDLTPEDRVSLCQEVITDAIAQLGDDVEIRRAAATVAILQPKSTALPSLLEILRENPEFSPEERTDLLLRVAQSYQSIGEPELALELYVEAADLQPAEITIPISALKLLVQQIIQNHGQLEEHRSTWDDMMAHLADIERPDDVERSDDIEGSTGPYSDFYTASEIILAAASDPDRLQEFPEARDLLNRARRERPTWAAVPRMQGELETLVSNREAAVTYLNQAIELGDRSETVIGRVIEIYLQEERNDEAKRLLEMVARERPQLLSGKFAQLAWTVGHRLEENSITLGVLREQATNSENASDKILLAYDYMHRGKSDVDVEDLLREACDEMPESPRPWLALVNFYTRYRRDPDARDGIDQNQDALDVIADAQAALPDDPPTLKPLTIARCYDMLRTDDAEQQEKYWNQAESHFLAAAEADPENLEAEWRLVEFYTRVNRMAKAEQRIEIILSPDSKAPLEVREWAKRRRALIVASSGSFAETTKALQDLKKTSSTNDAGRIENLRAQLAIYTSRNQAADRNEMLQVLKELRELTDGALTTRERTQLAAFCLAADDWELAQTVYREWIEAEPSNPLALAQFTAALIERTVDDAANLDEARTTLDRLRLIEPTTYRTASLEARWLAANGEPAEAAHQLSDFVQEFSDVSLDPVFTELQEQTDASAAIELLKGAKHLQGDATVAAALEKAEKSLQSEDEDGALAILKQLADAQFAFVQFRTDALKNAADFLDRIKQTDEAQQLYEVYVKRSPREIAVLEQARFLSVHGQVETALDLCRDAWDTNLAENVAMVVSAILREHDITDPKIVQPFLDRLQVTIEEAGTPQAKRDRLFELASLQDLLQDYDQAAETFFAIVQDNPEDVSAGNNLAYLWARSGKRIPEALTLIDHLIQKYGQSAELLDTKAVVLLAAGQSQNAVDILQAIVDAAPSGVFYLHLAEAQAAAGQTSAARESLQTAEQEGLAASGLHPLDRREYDRLRQLTTKR